MANPWLEIGLDDYENHMRLDSVQQLQTMNALMRDQLSRYPVETAMVLGVAGGNGLEHVAAAGLTAVYGVDINGAYLTDCVRRYPALAGVFVPVEADLLDEALTLPHAGLVVANLLVEYIGCGVFARVLGAVAPEYVSCAIQVDQAEGFVSDSPYLHVFDRLDEVHHTIDPDELTAALARAGYQPVLREEHPLPNGKALLRLDYHR